VWKNSKLRLAAFILAGILALGAVLIAVLHTPPVRRFALKQLVQILDKQGVDFQAGGIYYNLLAGTATLERVTVRSTQAPDLPPIFTADHAYISVSLTKALSGTYWVRDADFVNPAIHLVIDPQGRDNLPHPPGPSSDSEIDYLIDRLVATGGSLLMEDRRQQIVASLPRWRLSVDGNPVSRDHQVKLETEQPGGVSFEQREMPVRQITADLLLQKNALDVRNLRLTLRDSTIALAGRLNNFKDPRYDFKAETDLALGSLAGFAGVRQRISGTVHASIAAAGPLSGMTVATRLDGRDLVVDRFDHLNLKAEAQYSAAQERVNVASFNLSSPSGTVQGKSNIALNTKAGASSLNAAVRNLDLNRLSTAMQLPVKVSSIASGEVSAHWPALAFDQAAGDATLRLNASRQAPARNFLPVSGNIQVQAAGERVTVGISSLRALQAEVAGQVTLVSRRILGGDIRLNAPDLAGSVAEAEAFLGRSPGTLAGTNVGGSLQAAAKLSGTVQSPAAAFTFDSPAVQAGTLTGITIHASGDYNPARVAIQDAKVEWRDQRLTASGTVGLRGKSQELNLQAQTSDLSIPTLLAAAGRPDIPATGSVRLDVTATGTIDHPNARAEITGANLEAYQEAFGALTATALVTDQTVTLTALRLEKPQPDGAAVLEGTGSYNLQSKDYSANLAGRNLRLISMVLPNGAPVRAAIDLNASGQGNIDNPSGFRPIRFNTESSSTAPSI